MERSEVIAELKEHRDPSAHRLVLTKDYLIEEFQTPVKSGRNSWHLSSLSPHVGYWAGRSPGPQNDLKKCILLLACALVVYDSSIAQHVPELSLLLAGLALYFLLRRGRRLKHFRRREWSIFEFKNGDRATYCIWEECDASERVLFEAKFSEAVKAVSSH